MIINKLDNVEINLENGHKYAICDIKEGEYIIKYGALIGYVVRDIKKGEHIHTHNIKTTLSNKLEYSYNYKDYGVKSKTSQLTFKGFVRENGDVGVRNEIWIISLVGCVNKVAQRLSDETGAIPFTHPYGCSQLGDDENVTRLILKNLVNHPNAGGVLVLGLGCENNNIKSFKEILGAYNEKRVKFLNCQDFEDEIAQGVRLINELREYADKFKREEVNISKLCIGLKCGGSDGLSGITANPLVGNVSDKIISFGGSSVITEVPEMFGAEHFLMERCKSREVFDKMVSLINDFKDYYTSHNQVIYENPSPGNKEGGITTLEEKSLGCVQKGGFSDVVDVISYGDTVTEKGLTVLNGPGNDIVAVTNLTAAKVHIILFTTGRGTPLGAPVPTIKISTNRNLYEKKKNWIDFDASCLLNGKPIDDLGDELVDYILRVASGEETKNEINNFREIAIFKDGVTL